MAKDPGSIVCLGVCLDREVDSGAGWQAALASWSMQAIIVQSWHNFEPPLIEWHPRKHHILILCWFNVGHRLRRWPNIEPA